jgi:hypothetical protein
MLKPAGRAGQAHRRGGDTGRRGEPAGRAAAEAINRVLRAVRTTPAVHQCFGNYGRQSIQKGNWGQLMNYLDALHVGHIVIENARRPADARSSARRPTSACGLRLRKGAEFSVPNILLFVVELHQNWSTAAPESRTALPHFASSPR